MMNFKSSNPSDLEKAELHLGGSHAILWSAILLLWSATSFAWTRPAKQAWGAQKVYYSALFHTSTSSTPWKLVIYKKHSKKRLFAQISADGASLAECELRGFERNQLGQPLTLEMGCKNTQLESFTTTATLLWDHKSRTSASLRFGTWLQGYEQVPLTVQMDRFTKLKRRRHQIVASSR